MKKEQDKSEVKSESKRRQRERYRQTERLKKRGGKSESITKRFIETERGKFVKPF